MEPSGDTSQPDNLLSCPLKVARGNQVLLAQTYKVEKEMSFCHKLRFVNPKSLQLDSVKL